MRFYSDEEPAFFVSRASQDLIKFFIECKRMCALFPPIFFSQNIASRSDVSKACNFVDCHFVRFDSNQNATNFITTPHFEFHQNFLSTSRSEVIGAMHFQILKNQSMFKQKIYNFSTLVSQKWTSSIPDTILAE